jgi:hypothetical protein
MWPVRYYALPRINTRLNIIINTTEINKILVTIILRVHTNRFSVNNLAFIQVSSLKISKYDMLRDSLRFCAI